MVAEFCIPPPVKFRDHMLSKSEEASSLLRAHKEAHAQEKEDMAARFEDALSQKEATLKAEHAANEARLRNQHANEHHTTKAEMKEELHIANGRVEALERDLAEERRGADLELEALKSR